MNSVLEHFKKIIKEGKYENTYKMALAKALVELVNDGVFENNNLSISVNQVAEKFLKYYWNQTVFYDFIQNSNPEKQPLIIQTIRSLVNIYRDKAKHNRKTKYNEIKYYLKTALVTSYNQAINNISAVIVKDVAWRFTKLNDDVFDDVVLFDKENNRFLLTYESVEAIETNAKELNDLINYRWGLILESFNSSNPDNKKVFISENEQIDKEKLLFYETVIDIDKIQFKNSKNNSKSIDDVDTPITQDPKERIKHIFTNNHFDKMGFHLYSDRKEFEAKGIQLFAVKNGKCKVCFKNSNITEQKQLDEINRYGIDVHYGSTKSYEEITWDVSNCNIKNKEEIENPKRGYFVCEPLDEKEAVELVKYLVRIKNDMLIEEEDDSKDRSSTPVSEVIKYNPLKSIKEGKRYIPVLIVVKRKIYRISSWKEAFKIIMFFNCYKAGKIDLLDDVVDSKENSEKTYYIRSSEYTEENKYYVKFSPELYIRDFQNEIKNYSFLNKIKKWTSEFELYILRADINDLETDFEALIEKKKKSVIESKNYKNGSTKHLLASINGKTLSAREKFYIRVGKEFDKAVLIGDIDISDEEEVFLKDYMHTAINFMINTGKMYHHDKVFAFGMVRVALKHYASKTFWPYVNEEYGVVVSGNYQSIINIAFKNTLKRYNKLYFDDESAYVQNMCMHAFVCDKCADQLFDYIFEFWRIDLERSIENTIEEDGSDLFDILIEEIDKNKEIAVQNIMLHTTMALQMNPRGCKNRLRRILKMIDESYWNNADYSDSSNRLTKLFNNWVKNKSSLFYKDIKSSLERRQRGRGEKLLSRPSIIFNKDDKTFSILLPKQILRNCTPEEYPIWRIMIDGEEYTSTQPELIQGKASLYTKECSINIYKTDIYKRFEILLQSDRSIYCRRTIKNFDCRFFNAKGRNVDIDYDYISKETNIAFVKKDKELVFLNGNFNIIESFDSLSNVYMFDPDDGDIFILPNNHAVPVGRVLLEGIVGNNRVQGARATYKDEEYEITSNRDRLFFKASRSQFNGTAIKIYNKNEEVYFGKISSKEYVEFKWDDSLNDVYGYFIDLHKYINKNGIYIVDLSIPGVSSRRYKACYIQGFDYSFDDAPYLFQETGRISVPKNLDFCINEEWEANNENNSLTFRIDEKNKDQNSYVKDRKLLLDFVLEKEIVQISFDLPVLYWKFKKDDDWQIEKPGDIFFKNVPSRIYVDGNVGLSSAKMYIENGSDLEESEARCIYDSKEQLFYFRTVDIMDTLNREKVYRQFNILIDHKEAQFLRVICRSVLFSKNITGDFKNNKIYGNFEIAGSSDFMVNIYYDNQKIEDSIPVIDGRFEVECDVKGGTYRIDLYEMEDDDSGFDSVSFKIDQFFLEIMDGSNLEGKSVFIKSIRDREQKLAPLLFIDGYCIKELKRFDYYGFVEENGEGFYSYLYDSLDENVTSNFFYYTGSFGYYDHLNRFRYIKEALVIFDNQKNIGEALINIVGYDEFLPLIFSPNRQQLAASDKGFSRLEKLKAKTIDDDIFKIEIEIR